MEKNIIKLTLLSKWEHGGIFSDRHPCNGACNYIPDNKKTPNILKTFKIPLKNIFLDIVASYFTHMMF